MIAIASALLLVGCGSITVNDMANTKEFEKHDLAVAQYKREEGIEVPIYEYTAKSVPHNEATDFVKNMGTGWNLGNTLDGFVERGLHGANLDDETAWCGAYTTQEIVDAVKSAGFDTIRIPVTWHGHVRGTKYEIDEQWLNRVQEVVDYGMAADMYVIINIHHDIEKGYYYPDEASYKQSETYITEIWTQLSEQFKDYDEHLVFESVNEPRLKGSSTEWYIDGSDYVKESIDCINRLNQCFVDTVRSSGGNNAERFLMIPGYDTSVEGVMHQGFTLPQDSIDNRLIVTTHAYTPYSFALDLKGTAVFDENGKRDIDRIMTQLYDKYVSQGIPVIMGEYGAVQKNNLQDRVDFTAYYVSKASENGVMCIWWDNNAFEGDGECFGIFDRNSFIWTFCDILDAIMQNR